MLKTSFFFLVGFCSFVHGQDNFGWKDAEARKQNKVKSMQVLCEKDSLETYRYDRNGFLIEIDKTTTKAPHSAINKLGREVIQNNSAGQPILIRYFMGNDSLEKPHSVQRLYYTKQGDLREIEFYDKKGVKTYQQKIPKLDRSIKHWQEKHLYGETADSLFVSNKKLTKKPITDARDYLKIWVHGDTLLVKKFENGELVYWKKSVQPTPYRYSQITSWNKHAHRYNEMTLTYDEAGLLETRSDYMLQSGQTVHFRFHYLYYP